MEFNIDTNPVITGNLPEFSSGSGSSSSGTTTTEGLYLGPSLNTFSGSSLTNVLTSVTEYGISPSNTEWLAVYESEPSACVEVRYTDDDDNTVVAYASYSSSAETWLIAAATINGEDGEDGADGADAPETILQFSEDGSSNWTTTPTETTIYWRQSTDDGTTWTDAVRWQGLDGSDGTDGADGSDGNTPTPQFSVDGETDWHSTPADTDFYMRWSLDGGTTYQDAYLYHGQDGADGTDGTNGTDGTDGNTPIPQFSVDGSTDWHDTPADTDFYMRWSLDGGTTYEDAYLYHGQDGTDGVDGADGTSISFQYSVDGSSDWHDTLDSTNDYYWRWTTDDGTTYTDAIRFKTDEAADSLTDTMQTEVQSMIDASAIDSLTDNMTSEVVSLIETNGYTDDELSSLTWDDTQTVFIFNDNVITDPTTDSFPGNPYSLVDDYPIYPFITLGDFSTAGVYELFFDLAPTRKNRLFTDLLVFQLDDAPADYTTAYDQTDTSASAVWGDFVGFGDSGYCTGALTLVSDGTFIYGFIKYYGGQASLLTCSIQGTLATGYGLAGEVTAMEGKVIYAYFGIETDSVGTFTLSNFKYRFTAS